ARARLVGHPHVGVQVVRRRALAVELPDLGGRDLAGADLLGRLRRGEESEIAHAPGLGTRKPPSAGSGASSRIFSRGQLSRGSSARRTFSTSTTCEVGSTSSRSSSLI